MIMKTNRKLVPSRTLTVFSIIISAVVIYCIFHAFSVGNTEMKIGVVAVALLILLPVLKMPVRIYEDDEKICIRQVVGETVFMKKDYHVERVSSKSLFTIRLFATSVFLHWGYFWSKSTGKFYALCVNSADTLLLTDKSDGSKTIIDAP